MTTAPPPSPPSPAAGDVALFAAERQGAGNAWRAEATVAPGGAGCPVGLAARLTLVPVTEKHLRALAESVPAGCAVLGVRLPEGTSPASVSLEAAGESGGFVRCEAGRECPASGSYFLAEPVTRRGAAGTFVLGAFHSAAGAPRRAALVVESAP